MTIFKRGKQADEQDLAKWKHEGGVMARANAEIHDRATALSLRLGKPYKDCVDIIRAENPELKAGQEGKDPGKSTSYKGSKTIQYTEETQEIRRQVREQLREAGDRKITFAPKVYEALAKDPSLTRETVDWMVKGAISRGRVADYRAGMKWLETEYPELFQKYMTL